MWRPAVETRRRWRRNAHRFSYLLGRLLGYRYDMSRRLCDLIESQSAAGNAGRPLILVSFHTDGMYGLLKLAQDLDRPLICLVTREARRVITLFRWRPRNVRLVCELTAADVRSIKQAQEGLLVFADVNTSLTKMVHVPVFGKARVFSASWVSIARSLEARVIALTSVRGGRVIRLDGVELSANASASRLLNAAFEYMQGQLTHRRQWDMIVSHDTYVDCVTPVNGDMPLGRWSAMAACDPDVARLVARMGQESSSAPEAQDAVHASEPEAVRVDPIQSR